MLVVKNNICDQVHIKSSSLVSQQDFKTLDKSWDQRIRILQTRKLDKLQSKLQWLSHECSKPEIGYLLVTTAASTLTQLATQGTPEREREREGNHKS